MPELPEVEIVVRNLRRWFGERRIMSVRIADPMAVRTRLSTRTSEGSPEQARRLSDGLIGARSAKLVRHGKRFAWWLDTSEGARIGLLVHLGMSGNFGLRGEDEPRHGRLGFELEGGRWVWFVDQRRFGCVVPLDDPGEALRAGLGPDALLEPLDGAALGARCGSRRGIKAALLDQKVLAGVGNIQAIEALFRAGIGPARRCGSLSGAEWDRLARAIPEQLESAIAAEEGAEVHYITEGGPNVFALYDREGAPCPRCGSEIRKQKVQGRATYWCEVCQPSK